jgi:hypothetical protein
VCIKKQHTRQARYRLHGRSASARGTPYRPRCPATRSRCGAGDGPGDRERLRSGGGSRATPRRHLSAPRRNC